VELSGTVTSGGCGSSSLTCTQRQCTSPAIAGGDEAHLHFDRDFNVEIMPRDRTYTTYMDRFGDDDYAPASINMEWEFMYMFPLWISNWAAQAWQMWPDGFRPPVGDGKSVGVPWRGDPIKVRGNWILDCGHTFANNVARSEIHPPVAIAWMHPEAARDATVWLRASSHLTRPAANRTDFGGLFTASFQVPGGSNGKPYIGPTVIDWMVNTSPTSSVTLGICHIENDYSSPWGHFELASNYCDFTKQQPSAGAVQYMTAFNGDISSFFELTPPTIDASGNVSVTVQPLRTDAWEDSPYLLGAHFRVCYADCTAGRQQTNSCPPPASCNPVFGYLDIAQNAATGGTVFSAGDTLHVAGWAVDPLPGGTSAIQRIDVYGTWGSGGSLSLAGSLTGTSIHLPRQDVVNAYQSQYPGNDFLYSGFDGTVPFGTHPVGTYEIHVRAIDSKGYPFDLANPLQVTVACDPNTCPGCCDSTRTHCLAGTSNSACGASAQVCQNCLAQSGYACLNQTCAPCTPTFTCTADSCGLHSDGCGNTVDCGSCFDCSSCDCGCSGTKCLAGTRCFASMCAKIGGSCDPCAGCVTY
jgi:hypothetical protein